VLVVDDDADTRNLLATLLAERGAMPMTAANAREGMDAVRGLSPDVLVCDIAMPGDDGYSFMRRLRDQNPLGHRHIPAIALTAYAGPEHRERALASGFDAHLAKPIDGIRLAQLIADLLGRRSA
jgi:CheY-like chemotaxis protein